jgi:hypothetical protein
VLLTARCAAVAPPPGSASSCKRELRPPFDPPARRCAPWTSPKRAAFGYLPRAFRPWTLTRSLAPWTRVGGVPPRQPLSESVPPSPSPLHPARMECAAAS